MTSNNELTRERIEAALSVFKLHHKMLVNEIDGLTHDINESIDAFAVGIALAAVEYLKQIKEAQNDQNAELERQSVTDEDVAEAIEMFQENIGNNNACVAILTLDLPGTVTQPDDDTDDEVAICEQENKCFRLAIQALQAYRPEREPCEHCRQRKAWEVPNDGIYAYQEVNTLGEIQGWSLSVYGGMICFGNAQGRPTYIANCPMCGRRLEY